MEYYYTEGFEHPKNVSTKLKLIYPNAKPVDSLNELLSIAIKGDTVIFREIENVSYGKDDFCRNKVADPIIYNYKLLFNKGIKIVFFETSRFNSDFIISIAREIIRVLGLKIPLEQEVDALLFAYLSAYEKEQAVKFEHSLALYTYEKETNGKTYGRPVGSKSESEEEIKFKNMMLKELKTFGGEVRDKDFYTNNKIARTTFYNWKREIIKETKEK